MNRTTSTIRRTAGFTLLELLVVVAIIGILIAILVPLVTRVRNRALETRCLSNLRQIGIAVTLYQSEHEGKYPGSTRDGFRTGTNEMATLLEPYLPWKHTLSGGWVDPTYTCLLYPYANGVRGPGKTPAELLNWGSCGTYAYTHALTDAGGAGYNLARQNASVFRGDRTANKASFSHWKAREYGLLYDKGWTTYPGPPEGFIYGHNYYGIPGHHPTYNVLFADSHAAAHPWVHHLGEIDRTRAGCLNIPAEVRYDFSSVRK